MSLENLAAAAKKKTEEMLQRSPEDVAREALEDLEKKVKAGEWDPDEFSATNFEQAPTSAEKPRV